MSKVTQVNKSKVTVRTFQLRKNKAIPMTVMTAYDYTSARMVEKADIDAILVGDSLNMVMLGREQTNSVTVDEMLHHCKAVARGARIPFLIGDMPFMSYQVSQEEAIRNAGRFLQEGGMEAVKMEGGVEMADTIAAVIRAGIPVMGHIGLTPQTLSQLGGYRVQGKTASTARKLLEDALALQEAGCFSIVLESVPAPVAKIITEKLEISTIGIGAGAGCDGQVLVFHDALGMFDDLLPRFVRRYANVGEIMVNALATYRDEVREGVFPTEEHTYPIKENELEAFLAELEKGITES
ncbi:MAG: 3-methyl-2-oxobutanoate hydroxymethyltransferase [Anaerolineales bacterium]|nr:3-methyl-2-oxobutanoate hydroxymethyltransferase [Anaerolineales bacterium]